MKMENGKWKMKHDYTTKFFRKDYGEENHRLYQASGYRRQGQSRPSHRHGAGASGREHYGVLQTVQREDREHGRHQNPGRHHGLRRSLFYIHHQDTARGRSSEEGGEDREGFWQTEP